MSKMSAITILAACGLAALAQDDAKPALETVEQKGSYAIGANVGSQLQPFADTLDYDAFIRGFEDAMKGRPRALDEEAAQAAFTVYQKQAMDGVKAKNRETGATFLKNNLEDKEVVQLPSGLQYKILEAGDGEKPKATDRVQVHYTGTLIDGTKFDSSRDRGTPATFPVNGVIPGWVEGLQLMPTGSRWMLYIPGDLAYGERGSLPKIPPNSTLIFDVELIAIQ